MGYLSHEALDDLTKGRAELAPALRKLKGAYDDIDHGGRTFM